MPFFKIQVDAPAARKLYRQTSADASRSRVKTKVRLRGDVLLHLEVLARLTGHTADDLASAYLNHNVRRDLAQVLETISEGDHKAKRLGKAIEKAMAGGREGEKGRKNLSALLDEGIPRVPRKEAPDLSE